jgi:hypothetical protein
MKKGYVMPNHQIAYCISISLFHVDDQLRNGNFNLNVPPQGRLNAKVN